MQLTYIQQDGSPPIGDGGDQYTGLDRFGRVVDQRWMKESSGADLERVQYGFDRASNRVWRANPVAEALSANQDELYTYDGLNQLLTLQRGTLNSTKTGITGTPTWEEDLTFDPTGNWNNYVNLVNGTMTLNQPRTHNPVNEIVTISGSSALMVQDGAGNMIKAPKVSDWSNANAMIYDAWNRLVKVLDGGMTVAAYGYDGQNRRTTKAVGTTTRHYYYSSQWQILEERLNAATTADRQFVWGLMGIDNLILRDWGSERLYSIQDVFNSTAVVDANGTVQERYGYNAFGLSRVMDADFNPLSSSGYDWETRYASYRFDDESNFYQVRNRYLHPNLGRWLTRDPSEYNDKYNLYLYVNNDSLNLIDIHGLKPCCVDDFDGVVSGTFSGGLSITDYYPFYKKDTRLSPTPNQAGPYTNSDFIGAQIQFVSNISGGGTKCTFTQFVYFKKLQFGFSSDPRQGTTIDDVAASGQDQAKRPFRQFINGNPSFADPPSIPRQAHEKALWLYTSCLESDPEKGTCCYKKCCIKWTLDIVVGLFSKNNIKTHTLTKGKKWCQK